MLVHRVGGERLESPAALVAELLRDVLGAPPRADGGGVEQSGHSGPGVRIVGDRPLGVRRGTAEAPSGLVLAHRQGDRVPVALGHLPPVEPRQLRRLGDQGLGHREHLAVPLVEPACDRPGHLDVRQIVLPDGHQVALAEQDVRRLVDGIGQQQAVQRPPGGEQLGLDGRVAVELRLRDEAQEREEELVELGDGRVGEDRRPGGIDAGREIVQDRAVHVLADSAGSVAVRDDLVVREDHERLDACVLQTDALAEGADVVAEVELPGGPLPGQDAISTGVLADRGPQGRHACGGGGERVHGVLLREK